MSMYGIEVGEERNGNGPGMLYDRRSHGHGILCDG